MKASSTVLKLAALVAALAFLQGCATAPTETGISATSADQASSENNADVMHLVRPHERLGDIAVQYTGNSTNWKSIASYNGISNPRLLRIGATIAIPHALLIQQEPPNPSNQAAEFESQPVVATRPNATFAATNALALKRRTPQKSVDVVLKPVQTNRTFELNPMTESTFADQSQSKLSTMKVQVIGTYYPKGIYQEPANYSELVMRAAPGTLFELEYLANNWYKIVTNNGIGYLREDDGRVVSSIAQP